MKYNFIIINIYVYIMYIKEFYCIFFFVLILGFCECIIIIIIVMFDVKDLINVVFEILIFIIRLEMKGESMCVNDIIF